MNFAPNGERRISLPEAVGKGYRDFWHFKGRYRLCKGSRASKKSKTTALNTIYRIMKYPMSNALYVRRVFNTVRDSCYADLKWAALRLGVAHLWEFRVSPMEAEYKPTGQKIFFRGLDDPLKLASISVSVGYLCWLIIEEAFEIEKESDFDTVNESIRGYIPEDSGLFKQATLIFNPWSESHWIKKRFYDVKDPDVLAVTTNYLCNEWLDEADIKLFDDMKKNNPTRYKVAGLGEWGIDGGVVFEEWTDDESHYLDREGTHVIAPFKPPADWPIYRSFDFGFARPFSAGYYTVDYDGRIYRIAELYGYGGSPNEGVKWDPDRIAAEMKEYESGHEYLKGRDIVGVAEPSIWDQSRGESIAAMMERRYIYFSPADNTRLAGLMQCHYRLAFDGENKPMFYCFSTCRHFIRTVPALKYSETRAEDVDTAGEDHIYDEWRYLCMERPIKPSRPQLITDKLGEDPLRLRESAGRYDYMILR